MTHEQLKAIEEFVRAVARAEATEPGTQNSVLAETRVKNHRELLFIKFRLASPESGGN